MTDYYDDKRKMNRLLYDQMVEERQSYLEVYRELGDYIQPERVRFLPTESSPGQKKQQKIVDPTATEASETLSSGLISGMTNQASAWFNLLPQDPDMKDYQPVKIWLSQVEDIIRSMFLKSNLYKTLPGVYIDSGVFSTTAMSMVEHPKDGIRFRQFPIGSFCIAQNDDQRVDVFSQEFTMTVRQLVQKFGEEAVSDQVLTDYKRGYTERQVEVFQIIKPNPDYREDLVESKFKKFTSCYYETACRDDKILLEEGFSEFPILAPRWSVPAGRIYGVGPGRKALPHVKELQLMWKRKSQAVEKILNPPMVGPTSMNGQRASTASGDITYVDERQGQGSFRPAFAVEPRVLEVSQDIMDRRNGIKEAFFTNLFLMFTQSDRREITAEEIIKRQEEKITVLAPVLGQFDEELLKPLVDNAFAIAARQGRLPPAPPELQGTELKVEYISILHKAQRLASLGPIDRMLTYAERIAPVYPQILDKIDLDQTIDEAADVLGAPPKMIRSDEDVAAMRQQRAAAQQQAQKMAEIEQASKAAKNLSQSPMDSDNALSRIVQAQQQ